MNELAITKIETDAIQALMAAGDRDEAIAALLDTYRSYARNLAEITWLGISSDPAFIAGQLPLDQSQAIACAAVDSQIATTLDVHRLWGLNEPKADLAAIQAIDGAFREALGRLIRATPSLGARA